MKSVALFCGVGSSGLVALIVTTSLLGPSVGAPESERVLALGPLVLLEVVRTVSPDGAVEWSRSIPPSTLLLAFLLPAITALRLERASRQRALQPHDNGLLSQ